MRNLLEYPITKEEIVECLAELARTFDNLELCGDMRPLLLKRAIKIIKSAKEIKNEKT
jgi:hypothetical protein